MISKFFLASTGMRTAGQITGQVLTGPFPTKKESLLPMKRKMKIKSGTDDSKVCHDEKKSEIELATEKC